MAVYGIFDESYHYYGGYEIIKIIYTPWIQEENRSRGLNVED